MAVRPNRSGPAGRGLAALVLAAPLLVFVAALGTRTGQWSYATGHDLLVMRVGPVIADTAATIGLYAWQAGRASSAPPDDISTDLVEIPGFGALDDRRGGGGPARTAGVESCPGAVPAMTQVAPESAVWALQQSGFTLQGGVSVGRAAGSHRGFWFGTVHDAVIRIRPGRTDIRVAARDGRNHGGEACRLATRISEALRSGD